MTFKIYLKKLEEKDIEVLKQLPTKQAFVPQDQIFEKEGDAVRWAFNHSSIYVVKDET